ncbi:MAG: hypothetical protein M1540_02760 [Candidatus Bathyarchaeota archaeon]|nr:hypothetical protein [Candidatus Bathyarchaeota archaeon]
MKPTTFAVAFVLTVCLVLVGVAMFPVLAQAATQNNEFVFGFFLGPFVVVLFFCWLGEKLLLKALKKK